MIVYLFFRENIILYLGWDLIGSPLDLSQDYDRVVIFFDFGNVEQRTQLKKIKFLNNLRIIQRERVLILLE